MNVTERVKYGQASYNFRNMQILTITESDTDKEHINHCAFINGINSVNDHVENVLKAFF